LARGPTEEIVARTLEGAEIKIHPRAEGNDHVGHGSVGIGRALLKLM
jgi:hypothetical protein